MTATYLDLINRGAGYHPERTAIVFGDERLTFRAVHELSNQLAHALVAL
jgi:non-ribosomal peptide synthetase component E (peptide arylation enzyme)